MKNTNAILICAGSCERLLNLNDFESLTIHFAKADNTLHISSTKISHEVIHISKDTLPPFKHNTPLSTNTTPKGEGIKQRGIIQQGQAHPRGITRTFLGRSSTRVRNMRIEDLATMYYNYKNCLMTTKSMSEAIKVKIGTIHQWMSVITRHLAGMTPSKTVNQNINLINAAEYYKKHLLVSA